MATRTAAAAAAASGDCTCCLFSPSLSQPSSGGSRAPSSFTSRRSRPFIHHCTCLDIAPRSHRDVVKPRNQARVTSGRVSTLSSAGGSVVTKSFFSRIDQHSIEWVGWDVVGFVNTSSLGFPEVVRARDKRISSLVSVASTLYKFAEAKNVLGHWYLSEAFYLSALYSRCFMYSDFSSFVTGATW